MDDLSRILLGFVLAAVPSIILCRVVITLRIVDAPTEARKTQTLPVPTAGGIAIAISTALAMAVDTELSRGTYDYFMLTLGVGALACLLLGLADDILQLRALPKLLVLLAATGGMTWMGIRADAMAPWPGTLILLPVWLAMAGSMLWLVVVINAVNFMDGANGLAMGMAAAAAAGFAACGGIIGMWHIAMIASVLAGALAGFLVWNTTGKLFAGDAGALLVGCLLGGLGLEMVRMRPDLLFVPAILLLPFLSDVLLTLVWRGRHGKRLFVAHRDHAYQIAIKAGLRHWHVALVHAVFAANAAVIAVAATLVGQYAPAIGFAALLLVSTWVHWRVRRAGVRNGLVGADIA